MNKKDNKTSKYDIYFRYWTSKTNLKLVQCFIKRGKTTVAHTEETVKLNNFNKALVRKKLFSNLVSSEIESRDVRKELWDTYKNNFKIC